MTGDGQGEAVRMVKGLGSRLALLVSLVAYGEHVFVVINVSSPFCIKILIFS